MHIDEDTPGSIAHQEAVRVLKGWLFALYVLDFLICVFFGLPKQDSVPHVLWLLAKSLFWSYGVGLVVLILGVRLFGRMIRIKRITPVGFLRYCVVFALVSVMVGAILVYQEPTVAISAETQP